jgi:hypothetical protein
VYEIHGKTVLQKDFAIPYAIIQFDGRGLHQVGVSVSIRFNPSGSIAPLF